MNNIRCNQTIRACIGFLMILFLMTTGCSSLRKRESQTSSQAPQQKHSDDAPLYYDFGDVLIPSELKVDRNTSFVYQTPSFSAGVLVLKGRVEMGSLIAFFENNMNKDNWQLISSFKSPRTIMLYHKENRWCVINISETDFSTHVEIWVSPTSNQQGLLK